MYEREYGPLGPERGDFHAALVAYTTAAMLHSGKGKRPSMKDFVLRWGGKRRQTAQEQLNVFRALAARMNAREKRGDHR